jgi:hypothetical protein
MKFSYIAGLIPKEERSRFEKLLFRRTRKNVITIWHELRKQIQGFNDARIDKILYVVIYQESDTLRNIINKVCEAFSSEM